LRGGGREGGREGGDSGLKWNLRGRRAGVAVVRAEDTGELTGSDEGTTVAHGRDRSGTAACGSTTTTWYPGSMRHRQRRGREVRAGRCGTAACGSMAALEGGEGQVDVERRRRRRAEGSSGDGVREKDDVRRGARGADRKRWGGGVGADARGSGGKRWNKYLF
jgi:hypothetical protein